MSATAAVSVHAAENLLFFTLMQLVLILLAARVGGSLALRLGQARVVGEIVVGLLLGPSLFGALAPDAFHYVFHSVSAAPVTIMSQIGLTRIFHEFTAFSLVFCLVWKFCSVGRMNNYAAPSQHSPTKQNPARSSRQFMKYPG